MEENIEQVTTKLIEYIETTETFVAEQAPLVVQEILIEPWLELGVTVSVWLLLSAIFAFSMRILIHFDFGKRDPDSGRDVLELCIGLCGSVVGGMMWFIITVGLFSIILNCLSATFTPRLYIMDYLSNLL